MLVLDQARKDAAFAKLKQLTRGPSWSIPDPKAGSPTAQNPIREKGKAYQAKRKLPERPIYHKTPRPPRHNENQIHDLIVDHPFLLFTPRLFEGGLFLESIICKLPICRQPVWMRKDFRVPDFVYLTISGEAIKVTLVEIESSEQKLFVKRGPVDLHSDASEGLAQVREWREWMQEEGARTYLLKALSPLLSAYPYPLFHQNGGPSGFINFDVDYLLVVGHDRPHTDAAQAVLDRLYHEENIVVMSYPMMLEAAESQAQATNLLTYKDGHFRLHEVLATSQLAYAPSIALPHDYEGLDDHDAGNGEDVFQKDRRIFESMFALGRPYGERKYVHQLPHPSARLAISLRSHGFCEYPECHQEIIGAGGFEGANVSLQWGEDALDWLHATSQIMLCHEHRWLDERERWMLHNSAEMRQKLAFYGPYDWHLDIASQKTAKLLMLQSLQYCMKRIATNFPDASAEVIEDLRQAFLITGPIPPFFQDHLLNKVVDRDCLHATFRCAAPTTDSPRDKAVRLLIRFGALELQCNDNGEYGYRQTVVTERLDQWLQESFGEYYRFAVTVIFKHRKEGVLSWAQKATRQKK